VEANLSGSDAADPRRATEVDRQIGARIRARRLELQMSQEKLAEALGVTFQQVQKYERGFNRVAASKLFEIARTLDVNVAALLPRASASKLDLAVDGEAFGELHAAYAKLNAKGQSMLLNLARSLLQQPDFRRSRKN